MNLSIDQIRKGCDQFGISGLQSAMPISEGFANLNYKIRTRQGDFFYRVCLQQTNVELIYWEINLLLSLQHFDFPTAYMLVSKQGNYLVDTDHGKVMIYEFKNGHEPSLNPSTVTEIAKALARLNLFPDWHKFPRKNVINMDNCLELIEKFKNAPMQYPEVYHYFEEQTLFLKEFVQRDLPQGIIHGDCFPDNTIFQGDALVAIVDFEEACVDHLLMEAGMAINGFCFVDNQIDPILMNTFVKEYNNIRPLTKEERDLLPYYIQWSAHGMISWHLRYSLIFKKNDKQLSRVIELMNRVKALRKTILPTLEN
jgi:homoserine kinase type II